MDFFRLTKKFFQENFLRSDVKELKRLSLTGLPENRNMLQVYERYLNKKWSIFITNHICFGFSFLVNFACPFVVSIAKHVLF